MENKAIEYEPETAKTPWHPKFPTAQGTEFCGRSGFRSAPSCCWLPLLPKACSSSLPRICNLDSQSLEPSTAFCQMGMETKRNFLLSYKFWRWQGISFVWRQRTERGLSGQWDCNSPLDEHVIKRQNQVVSEGGRGMGSACDITELNLFCGRMNYHSFWVWANMCPRWPDRISWVKLYPKESSLTGMKW